jgi:trimethylamine---corrinoid protein Co-methyltransferase
MHIAGHPYQVLTNQEVNLIHSSAMRILAEMGMQVQNETLLRRLADFGLPVNLNEERVRFPQPIVERWLAECEHYDWENHTPSVSSQAGVYHGKFHDPATGQLLPWDEQKVIYYFKLARRLSNVGMATMLGCRMSCPPALEPLYERYYCWKYGANPGSSIYSDEICPYLLELYELRAIQQGQPLHEVFDGTIYLQPPLKLGRHEAYQVEWFLQKGLRVGIGDMFAMGASAPATLAGAVTLAIAEQFALRILNWALFGETGFHIGFSIAPMDMRTMLHAFGRPEMAIANVMGAQMARFYGASFSGHCALTDAKYPSPESGAQKALTGAITLLAGGSLWLDAGLLSTDEIYSPIQLVLDNELLSALKRLVYDFEISEDSIGLDAIFETGPGKQFLDKDHTLKYYRTEHWQPRMWTRTLYTAWMEEGGKLDIDKARDFALAVGQEEPDPPFLTSYQEADLLQLISRASRALGAA